MPHSTHHIYGAPQGLVLCHIYASSPSTCSHRSHIVLIQDSNTLITSNAKFTTKKNTAYAASNTPHMPNMPRYLPPVTHCIDYHIIRNSN